MAWPTRFALKRTCDTAATDYNLTEQDECEICRDARRDVGQFVRRRATAGFDGAGKAGTYRGLYHVLLGRLAPLDGIGPEQLTIEALIERVAKVSFAR